MRGRPTVDWRSISEAELHDEINAAWERMSMPQRRLWEVIRIEPEKWQQLPYGDQGGGFWAVAVIGRTVVWFNDIEDGFNRSRYSRWGEIEQYWCNQDDLEWTIQCLLDEIKDGYPSGGRCGPPEPLP